MTAWGASARGGFRRVRQAGDGESVRPRRLSGEEAVSQGANRREQANARVLRLVDERLVEERIAERQKAVSVGWNILGLRIDADGAFALALLLPLLFMAQLGMMGAAIFAAPQTAQAGMPGRTHGANL